MRWKVSRTWDLQLMLISKYTQEIKYWMEAMKISSNSNRGISKTKMFEEFNKVSYGVGV